MKCLFLNESSHPVKALKFLMFDAKVINEAWSHISGLDIGNFSSLLLQKNLKTSASTTSGKVITISGCIFKRLFCFVTL